MVGMIPLGVGVPKLGIWTAGLTTKVGTTVTVLPAVKKLNTVDSLLAFTAFPASIKNNLT